MGASPDHEPMPGLKWNSFPYQPDGPMDIIVGPDHTKTCETPRCTSFATKTVPAAWVELLWYPGHNFTVARCWKTCDTCHAGMVASHKEGP